MPKFKLVDEKRGIETSLTMLWAVIDASGYIIVRHEWSETHAEATATKMDELIPAHGPHSIIPIFVRDYDLER